MATVRQSGGDYTSLSAACSAAETTIDIDQAWTVADTTAVTINTANTIITVSGAAKHPGYISGGNYYRLEVVGGDAVDINANGCVLDGLVIKCASTGVSDEAVDVQGVTAAVTLKKCLIYANATRYNNQDGIYAANNSCTLNVEQCIVWNFSRGGIHYQNFSGTITGVLNVNSCVVFNCGRTGETETTSLGGVVIRRASGSSTFTENIHNTIAVGAQVGEDYFINIDGSGYTGNISHSIDSDNSIAGTIHSGSNNLALRTATDSDAPGTGNWVVFQDITTYPYDLRLKDNVENDAQDAHAVATAHGRTIPATDIVGTSRPQNTNYDIGAFEIVAGGTTVTLTLNLDSYIQKQLQLTSNLSSVIQKEYSEQISIDSIISHVQQITADLNANLTAQKIESNQLDSYINQLQSVSNSLDALLISTETIQEIVNLDSLLNIKSELSNQLDSLLNIKSELTNQLDSLVSKSIFNVLDLDALLNIKSELTNQLDSLLTKAQISSINVDSLFSSKIEVSNQLDSLISIPKEFSLDLDALLNIKSELSNQLDSYINQLQSVSNSLDALLISTVAGEEFVDLDALLNIKNLVSNQLDSLIYISKEFNANLDSLLSTSQERSLDLDALLNIKSELSNQLDSLLYKSTFSVVDLDSQIFQLQSLNFNFNGLVNQRITNDIDLDSLLEISNSIQIALDSIILVRQSVDLNVDSYINQLQNVSSSIDALLISVIEGQEFVDLDSLLTAQVFVNNQLDALIFIARSDVIDLDSYLMSQVSLLSNLSSLIQKSNQSLVNGDALLTTLKVINFSIDAVLVSIVGNTITAELDGVITKNLKLTTELNSELNALGVEITTLDSIIQGRQQLQFQFDAIITRELQQIVQLDGAIQKDFIIDTDLDSYVFTSNSLNNQIDAILGLRSLIELLMGGVIQKEIDVYSTFDAVLLDPSIEPIFSSKLKFKVNSGITFKVNRRV